MWAVIAAPDRAKALIWEGWREECVIPIPDFPPGKALIRLGISRYWSSAFELLLVEFDIGYKESSGDDADDELGPGAF